MLQRAHKLVMLPPTHALPPAAGAAPQAPGMCGCTWRPACRTWWSRICAHARSTGAAPLQGWLGLGWLLLSLRGRSTFPAWSHLPPQACRRASSLTPCAHSPSPTLPPPPQPGAGPARWRGLLHPGAGLHLVRGPAAGGAAPQHPGAGAPGRLAAWAGGWSESSLRFKLRRGLALCPWTAAGGVATKGPLLSSLAALTLPPNHPLHRRTRASCSCCALWRM